MPVEIDSGDNAFARAVLEAAQQKGIYIAEPEQFKNIPGVGIEAVVNGISIFVGCNQSKHILIL